MTKQILKGFFFFFHILFSLKKIEKNFDFDEIKKREMLLSVKAAEGDYLIEKLYKFEEFIWFLTNEKIWF